MHPRGQDARTAPEEGSGEGPTEACAAAAFAFAGIRAALHARPPSCRMNDRMNYL